MRRKPFPWCKLTPSQIDLIERLAAAGGTLPYGKLEYCDLLAFDEMRRLKLVDMEMKGRTKLQATLTDAGRALRDAGYRTEQVIVRVTDPQIELMRFLADGPPEDSVGQPISALPGTMLDVCRRMALRGWVTWYDGWNGMKWAKLTPAGREVVVAVNELNDAIKAAAEARRAGRLQ